MNYPLISEYIEAIKAAEDNFEELTNLRSVLGDDGQPVMTSGNFAVVFKMKDIETGKFYALKCFTKEQEGRAEAYHQIADALKDVDSPYLVSLRYLDKELFVDTEQTAETEFPVLLMDWVEGKTLDKYLRENLDDKYALEMLAYRFSQLAQWLIPQPFAHGDLKPDNILVREDGTLVLVDYDGMYVPAMKGQRARELGSPDFRHPLRTEDDFDEHIDDFAITSILLSLLLISEKSDYLVIYGKEDRLLFSHNDYLNIEKSLLFNDIKNGTRADLKCSDLLRNLCKNEKTYLTGKEIAAIEEISFAKKLDHPVDSYLDLLVSHVYLDLIDDTENHGIYINGEIRFREGFYFINCNRCEHDERIKKIVFPSTLKEIRMRAFYACSSLLLTNVQNTSLTIIGERAFAKCYNFGYVRLPISLQVISDYAFAMCGFTVITIPENVERIGNYAFYGCKYLRQIKLPRILYGVGTSIFAGCPMLEHIIIPKGSIRNYLQLLSEYRNLIIEEGSMKFRLIKLWNYIDEEDFCFNYNNMARSNIDPHSFL